MSYKNAAKFDTLRSVAFGSLTTSYAIVGPVLSNPAVAVAFKNNTNGIVLVSFDGINDNLVYPGQSYGVYDIRTNAPQVTDYLLSKGTAFLVKYSGSAPTSGSFYIEVLLAQT
jgi:hypothetical protein